MMFRCRSDAALSITYADEGAVEVCGYTPSELADTGLIVLSDLIHPDDRDLVRSKMQAGISEKRSFIVRYRLVQKDRTNTDVIMTGSGIFRDPLKLTGIEGYIIRINSQFFIKSDNARINPDINSDGKEIITDDSKAISAGKKKQEFNNQSFYRLYLKKISNILIQKQGFNRGMTEQDMKFSIVLIELLILITKYYNENDTNINSCRFFADLSDLMKRTFINEFKGISLSVSDITEELISGYQGLCLGIITCEQCCNVFKYAFNQGQNGRINLSLRREEDWFIYQIQDNGKGLSDSVIRNRDFSGGFLIIEHLSEELFGMMNLLNDGGAVVRIIFSAGYDSTYERNQN